MDGFLPPRMGYYLGTKCLLGIKYGNQNWEGGDFHSLLGLRFLDAQLEDTPGSCLTLTPSVFPLGWGSRSQGWGAAGLGGLELLTPCSLQLKLRPCKTQVPRAPRGGWVPGLAGRVREEGAQAAGRQSLGIRLLT